MAAEPKALPIQIRHADRLYIDGAWVAPKKPQRIEVISPHTEQVTAVVAGAGPADMDLAVAAARKAFDSGRWPRLTHAERAAYLMKLADQLEKRIPELSLAWTEQVGALQSGAPGMIGFVTSMVRYYAGLADKFPFVEVHQTVDGQGAARVVREPVGVVAAIAPWNAPYMIMINKIAPALLAGCTVIMKPAPETPLEAYIIAEAAEAAGFPPGVLNLVPADREASDHLVCNPGVDKVSFTGSTAVGKRIGAVCGGRIGRFGLELGGKSAAIVMDDFDVGAAAKILAGTISIMCGQVCATLSRAVVPRAKHDQYVEALRAELGALRVGDPYDPQSQMGPLAMKRQLERVEGYMEKGKAEGAQLICGGKRAATPVARLLLRADAVCARQQPHEHRAGGDLRTGDHADPVRRRGRCAAHRQRLELRPVRRSVHARQRSGLAHRARRAHRLDGAERLPGGLVPAVRRLQAVRHRARGRHGRPRVLHGDQDDPAGRPAGEPVLTIRIGRALPQRASCAQCGSAACLGKAVAQSSRRISPDLIVFHLGSIDGGKLR